MKIKREHRLFAWLLSEYSGFLPQCKDMRFSLADHSKLSVGVNVDGCAALCVSSVTDR